MTAAAGVLIVGASAAGLACAEGLRRGGYDGSVTMIGAEEWLPYDRPPLSKQVLSGEWPMEKTRLRPSSALAELRLDLRLGVSATGVDPATRKVTLHDGGEVSYDQLVIATGARPNWLPGSRGIHSVAVLRTIEDATKFRRALADGKTAESWEVSDSGNSFNDSDSSSVGCRLVIVGAGFLGTEAASVAADLGADVTMVSDRPIPLADAVGADVGKHLTSRHLDHGVRLEYGSVAEIVTESGRATGVRLAGGRLLPADFVLLAIGARPNIEWLSGSGLPVGDGVECDATCAAGDGIWAAGDVASWWHNRLGRRLRLDHRTNATEQGMLVAANILAGGAAKPFEPVPYIWSDQYGLRVQIFGQPGQADESHLIDGALSTDKFVAVYARDGRVVGAVGANMAKRLRLLRAAVAESAPLATVLPPTAS